MSPDSLIETTRVGTFPHRRRATRTKACRGLEGSRRPPCVRNCSMIWPTTPAPTNAHLNNPAEIFLIRRGRAIAGEVAAWPGRRLLRCEREETSLIHAVIGRMSRATGYHPTAGTELHSPTPSCPRTTRTAALRPISGATMDHSPTLSMAPCAALTVAADRRIQSRCPGPSAK
jgi:hypothetical protein